MSAQSVPLSTNLGALGRSFVRVPRWMYALLVACIVVAVVAAMIAGRTHAAEQYVTAPVAQQTLVDSVTASGTVNPQNNISVGTQVSGTIASIAVDFNSRVKKGEVLARLDPSTFQAQLDQAQAALAQARAQAAEAGANANSAVSGVSVARANDTAQVANIAAARANVVKAQAAVTLAQQTESRDAALLAQGFAAQSQVDTDRSTLAQDESAVGAAQAALAQAQAQAAASNATIGENGATAQAQAANADAAAAAVQSAQATVQQDELNLQHTVITSPVDGTVVARDISVGQTVAASLQTPTLFAIAQNLGKMEVDINVGEPDIGNVKRGDTVGFSVLAYPNQTFHGTVAQVRINPQTLNNVVTYDVVVDVNNRDGQLLPGMTANATVAVASAKNALVVPVAALAWKPTSGGHVRQSPWGNVTGTSADVAPAAGSTATLFVERGGTLKRVRVNVALTTSTQAAVSPLEPNALAVGDSVVVASNGHTQRASGATHSPTMGTSGFGNSSLRGIHP